MINPPESSHINLLPNNVLTNVPLELLGFWVDIKKTLTAGGVVKECMSAVAETLLEGKQKEEFCEKIKQIPMSASSATKKTEILTQDVLAQLDEAIH